MFLNRTWETFHFFRGFEQLFNSIFRQVMIEESQGP